MVCAELQRQKHYQGDRHRPLCRWSSSEFTLSNTVRTPPPAPGQSTSKKTGRLVNGYGMLGMCTCFIYWFPCVNASLINTVEEKCFPEPQRFSPESVAAARRPCQLGCTQHSRLGFPDGLGTWVCFLSPEEECFNAREVFKNLLIDSFKNIWRHVY